MKISQKKCSNREQMEEEMLIQKHQTFFSKMKMENTM
nr:MAG TPA: hypothetical protein [Caudoviricetes sp.]